MGSAGSGWGHSERSLKKKKVNVVGSLVPAMAVTVTRDGPGPPGARRRSDRRCPITVPGAAGRSDESLP
eukprot:390332-Hanusia_phi.AAC.1